MRYQQFKKEPHRTSRALLLLRLLDVVFTCIPGRDSREVAALRGSIFLLRAGKGWRKEANAAQRLCCSWREGSWERAEPNAQQVKQQGEPCLLRFGAAAALCAVKEVEARGKTGRKSVRSLLGKLRRVGVTFASPYEYLHVLWRKEV